MTTNYFNEVVEVLGSRQDYFPGTGGNISLKVEGGAMLIKASGKRISHMNDESGVVTLAHDAIREHFRTTLPSKEDEKISGDLISTSVHAGAPGRPSIETGFHTLLASSAVIHSHSVYVNLFACSSSFEKIAETIFLGSNIPYLCISYAQPGYYLTHLFLEKVIRLSSSPRVIFMKNHGVVVCAPTLREAISLHEEVTKRSRYYFSMDHLLYPSGILVHQGDLRSESKTQVLHDFIVANMSIFENIHQYILFPDLTVFCQDIYVTNDITFPAKVLIHKETGEVIYNTTKKEAHCIEENLIAFVFLMTYMQEHNLQPTYISQAEADSIRNMEQERYRKLLLQR